MTVYRLICVSVLLCLAACSGSDSDGSTSSQMDMSTMSPDAQPMTDAATGPVADTGMTTETDADIEADQGAPEQDATVVPPSDAGPAVDSELPQTDAGVESDQAVADASEVDAGGCIPTGPEICNDRDDDCDDNIDEEVMEVGTLCDVPGEVGLCTQGSQQCVDGTLRCEGFYTPVAEVCNGLDDDCDGDADNEIQQEGMNCSTGLFGVCSVGSYRCETDADGQTEMNCVPNVLPNAQVETCNGADDNCDGSTDEGFNIGLSCTGTTPAACTFDGTQVCNAAGDVICEPLPESECAEICNGVDDNFNGEADENIPPGDSCSAGLGACIRQGRMQCVDGGTPEARMECDAIPGLGSRELCNGVTDDCDERVDENVQEVGQPCDTGSGNVCGPGTYICEGGNLTCIPNIQQGDQEEVFNCMDDDCDGVIDEGAPGLGASCDVGQGIGQCRFGTRQCVNGSISCVANQPTVEVCNGQDDDCDGEDDEEAEDANDSCEVGLMEDQVGSNLCNLGLTRCVAGVLTCESSTVPRCEVANSNADEDCDGVTDEARERFCGEPELALERACIGVAPYTVPNGDDGIHLGVSHTVGVDSSIHMARASNAGEMVYTRLGAGSVETRHTVIGAAVQGTRASAIALDDDRPVVAFTLPRPYGPIVAIPNRDRPTALEHWSYDQIDESSWVSNDIALVKFGGSLRVFYRRITDTVCEQNRRDLGSQATVFACGSSLVMAERQNNGTWTKTVLNSEGASGVGVTVAKSANGQLFVAHGDTLNGNLKVEYYAGGQWQSHAEPASPAVGNRPAPGGTSGLRPSAAALGDEVIILHAPQMGNELDELADSGIVYATRYDFASESWVSESVGLLPAYSGGGQSVANLEGRAWIFSRERARTSGSIQIELDTLSLSRYTEPRFVQNLETYRFGDTRHLLNNLQLSADPFGLPIATFSDQPVGSGNACQAFGNFYLCQNGEVCECASPQFCGGTPRCIAPERVCFYRPIDSDNDRVPDYEENARGTNPDVADSDGDGRSDGEEILIDGTDPLQ